MHLAAYRTLDLPFTYVPFKVDDLRGAITGMRALGIRGFGVSMPYKVEIIPLLDALDPLAASIGAVNTVVNDGGRLTGYNTDADGAARALEEVTTLAGTRCARAAPRSPSPTAASTRPARSPKRPAPGPRSRWRPRAPPITTW